MLALLLGGCTAWRVANLDMTQEREAASMYVWSKRGTDVGDTARLYCLAGSLRERRWMRETLEHHASPAKVTITCPE